MQRQPFLRQLGKSLDKGKLNPIGDGPLGGGWPGCPWRIYRIGDAI